MTSEQAAALITELLRDSTQFAEEGRAYCLLQYYFDGYPVETLSPLLRHVDPNVRRSAAFIVSELAGDAAELLDDVLPLVTDEDVHVRWYAMESVMMCARGKRAPSCLRVFRQLECGDQRFVRLAMRLLERSSDEQLLACEHKCRVTEPGSSHHKGLKTLLDANAAVDIVAATSDTVWQLYCGVGARKQGIDATIQDSVIADNPTLRRYLRDQ